MKMAISVCDFVKTNINNLGTGKVVSIAGSIAVVEYFESIAKRQSFEIPVERLRPFALEKQTRCYIYDEEKDSWLIGRIEGFWDSQYDVALPGDEGGYYNPSNIFVRCDMWVNDPTEVLSAKGHETAFFHNNRSKFVRNIVKQRAVSRGMTGLISSKIDLYAHQVEVVRRVLEDPIQRYLLADEVGLGKTIEAGIIIRQFLLDNHRQTVLILVPPTLIDQWKNEVRTKFGLNESKGYRTIGTDKIMSSFKIIGTDEINSIDVTINRGMVVIDEAHHIAAKAFSNAIDDRDDYQKYAELCHNAEGLLLLSATPVLNHEEEFLAMLHLLDPDHYRLSDKVPFHEMINKRQDIGRLLLSFSEGSGSFMVKRNLQRIATFFPNDEILRELTNELQTKLNNDMNDECIQLIRTIRLHISDTYRLHRRLLRNRRDSITDLVLVARETLTTTECDLGETIEVVNGLLDSWRDSAFGDICRLESSNSGILSNRRSDLIQMFLLLFETAGSSFTLFKKVITTRLTGIIEEGLKQDIGLEGSVLLSQVELFDNEKEILLELKHALENANEEEDRIELLLDVLRRGNGRKFLVFTSYPSVGKEIVSRLTEQLGSERVAAYLMGMEYDELRANIQRFTDNVQCFVMVSDASGEEGRNLQDADVIIHFDLPWSPNRIEQRIGRVDRIGNESPIRSYVFIGPDIDDSLFDAWYRILHEGIGVFEKSIASLQFYIDRKMQELAEEFFIRGVGLTELIEEMQQEIEMELTKISEQEALDEIDALAKNAQDYYLPLKEYENEPESIRKALEPWICEALRFRRNENERSIRYEPSAHTLIPRSRLLSIELNQKGPGTYYRNIAKTNGSCLYRLGESFIDAIEKYIRWDDRGQVFAIWRHMDIWNSEDTEWAGFRFDYIVEADVANAVNKLPQAQRRNPAVLRRRSDAYFPPKFITVFIGLDLEEVTDEELLKTLNLPFDKSIDTNLTKHRLQIIDQLIDPSLWPGLCRQARDKSEQIINENADFITWCKKCSDNARQGLDQRVTQLKLRTEQEKQLMSANRTVSEKDVEIERALCEVLVEGIEKPRVAIDSVGFICLSGRRIG